MLHVAEARASDLCPKRGLIASFWRPKTHVIPVHVIEIWITYPVPLEKVILATHTGRVFQLGYGSWPIRDQCIERDVEREWNGIIIGRPTDFFIPTSAHSALGRQN